MNIIQWNEELEKRYAQLRYQKKWSVADQRELKQLLIMRDYVIQSTGFQFPMVCNNSLIKPYQQAVNPNRSYEE